MTRTTAKSRMVIGLKPELKEWYDSTADALGLTTTALIVMVLTEAQSTTQSLLTNLVNPSNVGQKIGEPLKKKPKS